MDIQPEPTLLEFIRYNTWANQQLLRACQALSEAQLTAENPGGYGSLRATWRHVLRAEADYLGRITGAPPAPAFDWEEAPSLAAQAEFAAQVGAAFLDLAQHVPPTQMVHEEESGFTMDYQARQLFMQYINHGIDHRASVLTALGRLGVPAPELDNWGYMAAHPERFKLKEGRPAGQ